MGTRFPRETLRYAKDLPREAPGQVALDRDLLRCRRSEVSRGPLRLLDGLALTRQTLLQLTKLLPESLHRLRRFLGALT